MPNLSTIQTKEERRVLRAFRDAVQSIKDQATLQEIVRLLEAGNVDGVIELLQLDQATFQPLEETIREAYRTGGLTGAEQIGTIPTPLGGIAARFNLALPGAAQWLAQMSSRLVTEIFDDQRQMVRERLTDALNRGINPRQSALDLIGRVDRGTGKRVGGFLGLTTRQAEWVAKARQELESLDPNYLTRALRDKRFDSSVRKAINDGKPLSADQVNRIITQLQNRTQRYRGQVIARTESINALRAGQFEAIKQAAIKGDIDPRDVTKGWDSSSDARTREDHLLMEATYKKNPIGLESAFIAPDSSRMLFPGDTSLGASAKETIQCRCKAVYRIDFAGQLRRVEGFG